MPYPSGGGSFNPYPPATGNNFGGFPPYPTPGNVIPAATSGPGYPPYMNFPQGPGYNSGYVCNLYDLYCSFYKIYFRLFHRILQILVQPELLPKNI